MTCNQDCNQGRACNCGGWHVYPVNDLREHDLNGNCWCKPTLDDEGSEPIWIHNSMDGREAFETDAEAATKWNALPRLAPNAKLTGLAPGKDEQ